MSGDQSTVTASRKLADRAAKEVPKPATPYTPASRFISSNYSSPGSTFGKEEDAIIVQLNARSLEAGIEGESCPQCRVEFKPRDNRRVGDYRTWLPGHAEKAEDLENWGAGYELWQNDLADTDLGLVGEKLERVFRELYNKHLLVDAGSARLVLVIPSLLPHPVLSVILQTLFDRWNYPSITLLPIPNMAVIGAGLRSGLVVDIGWEETIITAVYEYREVGSYRTTRAMKLLTKSVAKYLLESYAKPNPSEAPRVSLENVEDILVRLGDEVCVTPHTQGTDETTVIPNLTAVDLPLQGVAQTAGIDTADVRLLVMQTLFSQSQDDYTDDHELAIDLLMFHALLSLPTDVRSLCMSRVVFIGACDDIPSLSQVSLQRFEAILKRKGWNKVQGKHINGARKEVSEVSQPRKAPPDASHSQAFTEKELAEERYLREKTKSIPAEVQGIVRQVETLGPWAGASLLTNLKIKGFVEVQRERFLSQGLSGAVRDSDISVMPQQRTGGLAMRSKAAGERTSWTLAGWA